MDEKEMYALCFTAFEDFMKRAQSMLITLNDYADEDEARKAARLRLIQNGGGIINFPASAAKPTIVDLQLNKNQKKLNAINKVAVKSEEFNMLIKINGVSISKKQRSDSRYQGYVIRDKNKKFFYAENILFLTKKIYNYLYKRGEIDQPFNTKSETAAISFGKWAENFVELYKKPIMKPKTFEAFGYQSAILIKKFGKRTLKSITTDELQEYFVELGEKRSRDVLFSILNQIFKKAVKTKKLQENPCDGVELKKHVYKKINAFTIEEEKSVLNETENTRFKLLFLFLFGTGARIGEALALTAGDIRDGNVKINKNIVHVGAKEILQDTPKTQAGNRTVPMPAALITALKCFENVPDETRIFPFTYNGMRLYCARISKKLNFKITLHRIRHTYATRLEELGVQPKVKQYLLGHAKVETTENIYTDVQTRFINEQKSKIDDLIL